MNPNTSQAPSIFSQIRQEIDGFLNTYSVIVPGYSFSQYQTIKRINLYLNSKFEESPNESFGPWANRERLFFNVVVPACEVATKMLNVDTKDIRLLPTAPKHHFATYLLEKELRQWLKTSKLANVLNQIAEQTPQFGTTVIEKTKQGARVVDLRKLMLDPTVEFIKDSRFVTTVAYMTPSELRKTGWDNVDTAIERFGTTYGQTAYEDRSGGVNLIQSSPYIKVYKRYGEVPQSWLDGGKSDKMTRALFIVAGVEEQQKTPEGKNAQVEGVVLFKSPWVKEWPFKDYHYKKIMGRWLGLGIVESLFDDQVRFNELKNQRRLSMEISTTPLFQTKDKSIVRNILTDLQPGDILVNQSGIEPVVNEERNLAAYRDEEASYGLHVQRLSFAYDAVSGETPVASTTATATINATQQATSVFGFKKENYTNMLRDFFNDLVLPELLNDLTPEHIMRFTGSAQELRKLDDAAAEIYANDAIIQSAISGRYISQEEVDALKQKHIDAYRKLGESRYLKIKNAFYNDAEFEFDFNTGNEQINPQTVAQNAQALLASYNPQAMQDPYFKLIYMKYAEALGISQGEIELAANASENQQIPMPMQGSNQLQTLTKPQ